MDYFYVILESYYQSNQVLSSYQFYTSIQFILKTMNNIYIFTIVWV